MLPGLRVIKTYFVISSHLGRVPVSGVGLGKVGQDRDAVGSSHSKVDAHVVGLTTVDNLLHNDNSNSVQYFCSISFVLGY